MSDARHARSHRWSDLPRDEPMALLERRRLIGEKAMLSQILLRKGCVVPVHAHENEQFTVVLRGKLRFTLPEAAPGAPKTIDLAPGEVLHLPSNAPHGAEAVEEALVIDIFSPPSATTGIDRH